MSFKKSNWGWSRTGHPTYLELNALFWQVGDFGLVAAILANAGEKSDFSTCEWTMKLLNRWYKDWHLSFFGALDKKGEVIISWGGPCLQILSRSCFVPVQTLAFETWRKARLSRSPTSYKNHTFSVLTFVNPMLRFWFNIDQILINQY